jgi:hypothetical protein
VVSAAAVECLLGARRERELLSLMEGDYQDTGAQGRWGRSRVCF